MFKNWHQFLSILFKIFKKKIDQKITSKKYKCKQNKTHESRKQPIYFSSTTKKQSLKSKILHNIAPLKVI